jgi:thiamine biosynthesis lipoprotein
MHSDRVIGGSLIMLLAALVGVGLWKTSGGPGPGQAAAHATVVRQCRAVMGTDCTLAVVVPRTERPRAERLLQQAEAVLRAAEARMSTWLNDSDIGRLNAAGAGQEVPLSPETLEVLRIARQAKTQTGGAFDVTCRPLVELWRAAGQRGVLPSDSELAQARAESNWDLIELTDDGGVKRRATARVDLGGIAKGWAIDRAAELLSSRGPSRSSRGEDGTVPFPNAVGGIVDVGGDLVCFGKAADGGLWPVDIKDPAGPGRAAKLRLPGGAVCTSGGYARFVQIGLQRYSHIIDPRTGRPAETASSVTVVAAEAVTADVWATALSVLGPEGLTRLPAGVEAMIIVGGTGDGRTVETPGFRRLLAE